jgi:hypothetical protein
MGIRVSRLSGPIGRPREWEYEAEGTVKDVVIDPAALPRPVSVASGGFRADTDSLSVTELDARTLDASARISGALDGYRRGFRNLRATLAGEVGPEALRWVWDNASLPPANFPAAPVGIRDARIGLDNGGTLSAAGTFTVGNELLLATDLVRTPGGIDVRDLTIRDADSSASMAFRRREDELAMRFNGRLSATTLDRMFAERRNRRGRIEGDFRARVPLTRPEQTAAEGKLEAWDLHVPTPAGPLGIDHLDLSASGNRLNVRASSFALGAHRFSVTGEAAVTDAGVVLDMDLATGGIAWDNVAKAIAAVKEDRRPAAAQPRAIPHLPVTGSLRLSADFFALGGYTWKPVRVDIRRDRDSVAFSVREADLCGISTRGDVKVQDNDAVSLDLVVASSGPDIGAPLSCLGYKHARLTGSYDFRAAVAGRGAGRDLPRAIRGPLKLEAANGHIGKADVLARVLVVLSVTEVFAGKVPDLFSSTMSYNKISLEGSLEDGKVFIREGVLDSPSITMAGTGSADYLDETVDFVILSHPLTTVDKVIQMVPGVRYVLGGHLVSVAAKVTGNADDPKISILPAKEVGKGIMGILERTLKLPVVVISPKTP